MAPYSPEFRPSSTRTKKAADDGVHKAPGFKGVQAQHDESELLIELCWLFLNAAVMSSHVDA